VTTPPPSDTPETAASRRGVRTAQTAAASRAARAPMPSVLLAVGGLGALRRGSGKAGMILLVVGGALAWAGRTSPEGDDDVQRSA